MALERGGNKSFMRLRERHPQIRWTPEVMAARLAALKEAGEPINPSYLHKNHGALYNRILNWPGGWQRIVTMAGFDPQEEAKGPFGPGLRMRSKKPWWSIR